MTRWKKSFLVQKALFIVLIRLLKEYLVCQWIVKCVKYYYSTVS